MLSKPTIKCLADLIQVASTHELNIEAVRQVLCEQSQFDPIMIFNRIKRSSKDYITSTDIYGFLKDNKIDTTESDCFYVLKGYDQDNDDKLTYKEFIKIILPSYNPELHEKACIKQSTETTEFTIPYDIEYSLTQLLEKEIKMYRELDAQKGKLNVRFDYSISSLFEEITDSKTMTIDISTLHKYLMRNEIELDMVLIEAFIKRLDKDRNGYLTFIEFADGITPQNPKTKLRPHFSKTTETFANKTKRYK